MVGKQAARGYGYKHRQTRELVKVKVLAGQAVCSRCNQRIQPTDLWDLDHNDNRQGYKGPSHRACNRSTAGPNAKGYGEVITNPQPRSATRW